MAALAAGGTEPHLHPRAITCGVVAVGIAVRLAGLLYGASLSGDEAMLSLNIGGRTLAGLARPLDYAQVAPVPFLWAEKAVAQIGGVNEYSLRIIPFLAGVASLLAFWYLARTLLRPWETAVAMTLVSTSFPLIRYSAEVKPYAIDVLITVLLLSGGLFVWRHLAETRAWWCLALGGATASLVSTPAPLVCAGMAVGFATMSLRARRWDVLRRTCLLVGASLIVSAPAYIWIYREVGASPYMKSFWGATFLQPGTPNLIGRIWRGLGEPVCTVNCWRGLVDLRPVLMILAFLGVVQLQRRWGLPQALLVIGPLFVTYVASGMGLYPISMRLMLFAAPIVAVCVAAGLVWSASIVEGRMPVLRARWTVALFLLPSLILTLTLAIAPQDESGFSKEEIRPLIGEYERRSTGEPVYVFARAAPAWIYHTTDWTEPDTVRLSWATKMLRPGMLAFPNGPSRGVRSGEEGVGLIYRYRGRDELFGTATGSQGRAWVGYFPPTPDQGWAESEAARIRAKANPHAWLIFVDFAHTATDEREVLMSAVKALGGKPIYWKTAADAILYRVRFGPSGAH